MELITATTAYDKVCNYVGTEEGYNLFHRYLSISLCYLNQDCVEAYSHIVSEGFPIAGVTAVSETQDGMIFLDFADGSDRNDEDLTSSEMLAVADYFHGIVDETKCGAFVDIDKLSKAEVEARLDEINEQLAHEVDETNEDDYFETNANGYYVDLEKREVSFEFTVMNDKWWDDIPFDEVYERFGLDIARYADEYFKLY